jgi:RNAse (barnase) inhibitor barstar
MAMAVFKVDEVHDEQLNWTILREGGVCLYWRQEILTDEVNWLKSNEYRVISFDAVEWESTSEWELERRMHESFKTHLSFPDYNGMNLNALDECMQDDLVVPDSGGLVVVLNHFDHLHKLVHDQASDERSTAEVGAPYLRESRALPHAFWTTAVDPCAIRQSQYWVWTARRRRSTVEPSRVAE